LLEVAATQRGALGAENAGSPHRCNPTSRLLHPRREHGKRNLLHPGKKNCIVGCQQTGRHMDRNQLLGAIDAHLEKTGESPYKFGKRVLGDIAFVWKLRNSNRQPWERTWKAVMKAIASHRAAPKKKKMRAR
jgi:hypothetical protein